jgi:anti-anti-sigma regulatory factor
MEMREMDEQEPVLKVEECAEAPVIRLSGTANLEAIQSLHEEGLRLAHLGRDVVVDWSAAEYVDACVLQELIALGTALAANGKKLSVRGENPKVAKYLQLAGLAGCFPALARDT